MVKIQSTHQERTAYVYVRQSTPMQVIEHRESTERQYHLRERAIGARLAEPAEWKSSMKIKAVRAAVRPIARDSNDWFQKWEWERSDWC